MKNLKLYLLIALAIPFISFIHVAPDCSIMKAGTFKYLDVPDDPSAYFEIDGKKHTEYHENGKYIMRSKIEWINECTYELTLKKSDNPALDFKRGTTMRVTIEDTQGNIISYKATMGGNSWHGKLKKTL